MTWTSIRLIRLSQYAAYRLRLVVLLSLSMTVVACAEEQPEAPKKKPEVQRETPEFQYELDDIKVSIPTPDEPRVKSFGPASLKAAAKYLEIGAVSWSRGTACVSCHTTGAYLTEFPAWSKYFGKPHEEVHETFVYVVPDEIEKIEKTEKRGHIYFPRTTITVWRTAGLAEYDKHVTGKLSKETELSLRDMFERQWEDGSFVTHSEVEVPHVTTNFEITLQAARAITAAPAWLANLKDKELLAKVDKLKEWLRTAPPANDFDRVLKLQLAYYLPELVTQKEREAALKLLSSKQHADGGWSIRDMSSLDAWHYEISDKVRNVYENLPDADNPESDPYMTALAIVLMRQNDVPVSDPRIQQGLAWLKREQRESGRWWMYSMYRGNYNYITYIATIEAMKALELCGELDAISADKK